MIKVNPVKSEKDLFDLSIFGSYYQGLFFDENSFLWCRENSSTGVRYRRCASQDDWPISYTRLCCFKDFKREFSNSDAFKAFKKKCEEKNKQKNTLKGKFIVGLVDSYGAAVFSAKPMIFDSMDEVENEIKTKGAMGIKVAVFQCVALAEIKTVEWE